MAVVLDEVEVQELVQGKRKLVWVDAEDTLEHALGVLRERSILAMPVRLKQPQEVGGAALPQEFCGLLSVLDVAAFVARDPDACGADGEPVKVHNAMRKTAESWHMLLLDPHAKVGRAMEFLGVRGFHRALVPNVCLREHAPGDVPVPSALRDDLVARAKGEEYRVLSQLDLARFILAHEGRFGLALAQNIEAVGLEGGKVLATTPDEKLSDALDRMAGHAVSALAVVDRLEPGAPWAAVAAILQDTLSASDLRGCSVGDLRAARGLSVGAFLEKRRGTSARKQVTCTRTTELRTAVELMLDCGVHRLWIVGEAEAAATLLGVVSLSDVIRVMRILPATNSASDQDDLVQTMLDNFMWVEWMA